ncbi:hypothetical protein PWT90_03429 [Aphanocladium album]|nr:hypothetical protein PWT90_03429 [Aphanocladium album]
MEEFETWLREEVLTGNSALTPHLDVQDGVNATVSVQREQNGHRAKDVLAIQKDTTGGGHPYVRVSAEARECCQCAPRDDVRGQIFTSGQWVREGSRRVVGGEPLVCIVSATVASRPTTGLHAAHDTSLSNDHNTIMRHTAAGLASIFMGETSLQEAVGFYLHGKTSQVSSIASEWEWARNTSWKPMLQYAELEEEFWSRAATLGKVAKSARWTAEFLHSTSIFFANAGGQVTDKDLRKRLRIVGRLLEVFREVGTAALLIITALGHNTFKADLLYGVADDKWPALKNSLVSGLRDLTTAVACRIEGTRVPKTKVQTLNPAYYCEATHPQNAVHHENVSLCECSLYLSLGGSQNEQLPSYGNPKRQSFLRKSSLCMVPLRQLLPPASQNESKPLENIVGKKSSASLIAAIEACIKKCATEGDGAASDSAGIPDREEDAEGEEVDVAHIIFGSAVPEDFGSGNRQYDPVRDDRAGHVAVSPIPQSRDTWPAIPSNGWLNPAAPPFGSFHEGDGVGSIYGATASGSGAALDGRGACNSIPPPTDVSLGTSGLGVLADVASQICPPSYGRDSGYGSSQPSAPPNQYREQPVRDARTPLRYDRPSARDGDRNNRPVAGQESSTRSSDIDLNASRRRQSLVTDTATSSEPGPVEQPPTPKVASEVACSGDGAMNMTAEGDHRTVVRAQPSEIIREGLGTRELSASLTSSLVAQTPAIHEPESLRGEVDTGTEDHSSSHSSPAVSFRTCDPASRTPRDERHDDEAGHIPNCSPVPSPSASNSAAISGNAPAVHHPINTAGSNSLPTASGPSKRPPTIADGENPPKRQNQQTLPNWDAQTSSPFGMYDVNSGTGPQERYLGQEMPPLHSSLAPVFPVHSAIEQPSALQATQPLLYGLGEGINPSLYNNSQMQDQARFSNGTPPPSEQDGFLESFSMTEAMVPAHIEPSSYQTPAQTYPDELLTGVAMDVIPGWAHFDEVTQEELEAVLTNYIGPRR